MERADRILWEISPMEISTEIIKEKNLRQHSIEGLINVPELIDYLKQLHNAPDFDSGMKVLWDLRKADLSLVSTPDVRSIMESVVKPWRKIERNKAALVVSGALDYGLSRMFQIMMGGETTSTITVFKDLGKAKEWLETV